ncbi:MAG: glycosyltransferase [Methylobacterium sp.]|uniref:glycosyltransferase n=1 Tax=Methylobacterium sp. TaxID=409 RepID=UPI0025E6433F|nr:glycosyltransferase [Methylobacterium sp.]MBX9932023.1 glycosyltransferase [Methylobacterium sp.]
MVPHRSFPAALAGSVHAQNAYAFGYVALGAILAEFASRLWQFQRFLPDPGQATLLFCARGGLRLQLVYERFLVRTALASSVQSDNLMISRLVAARLCALAPTPGLLDELGREFRDRPMSDVAAALTQRDDLELPAVWYDLFEPQRFTRLMAETEIVRAAVAAQNALFRSHLESRTQGRPTVILCDTGLYGSTVRLMREAMPERRWLCVQFARSNYKGYAAPHFDCTVGLSVERDVYAPWDRRTAALRFWHLIESVLEPELPSVKSFTALPAGSPPRANLEIAGWRQHIEPSERGLFSGALAYVDGLDRAALPRIAADAEEAWSHLKRAVTWPNQGDVALLALQDRSRDFGRADHVAQFAGQAGRGRLPRIRDSLWREGAIVQAFPRVGRLGLALVEAAHTVRAIRAEISPARSPQSSTRRPDPSEEPAGSVLSPTPAGSHP